MSQEQQDRIRQGASNQQYITEGVMRLRLDTQGVISYIENSLRGGQFVPKKKDGNLYYEFDKYGKPMLNDEGVQSIMSLITPWFSPHTVQGNFTYEQYENYIYEIDVALADAIMINLVRWEIDIHAYDQICNLIIITAEAFFSRTINDGERHSYANTVHVSESNTVQQNQGWKIPILGR